MIEIRKVGELYHSTYKKGDGTVVWKTENPLSAEEVIERLQSQGAHQIDVFDALKAADPQRFARPGPRR
jgi:hypothetical protein